MYNNPQESIMNDFKEGSEVRARRTIASRSRLGDSINEEENEALLGGDLNRYPEDEFERLTSGYKEDQNYKNVSIASQPATAIHDKHGHHGDLAFRMLDEVLEGIGIGSFQKFVLVLCSFGAFVDAAETAMMGLLFPTLREQWNLDEDGTALIASMTAFGMMFGAVFFGWVSDTYGRRLSYQISLTICATFGLLSSFATSLSPFVAMRFFLGIGYGGNLVATTSLLIEFTPNEYRGLYMSISGIAFGIGAFIVTGLAWAIIPTIGWQWLLRIAAFMAIPVFISLCWVPESPRFYIMTGQYDKAVIVADDIAKRNGKSIPPSFNETALRLVGGKYGPGNYHYHEYTSPSGGGAPASRLTIFWNELKLTWRALTRHQVTKSLVPLVFVWFGNNFASTIFWVIPLEISKKYQQKADIAYEIALIMAAGDLLGCFFTTFLTVNFNRLTLLHWGTFCSFVSCISMGFATELAGLFVASFLLQFAEQVTINTLYLYSPEVFPTGIRVRAFGVCMLGHRIAPTIAPFVLAALDEKSFKISAITMSGVYFFAFLVSHTLSVETFNSALVEDDTYDVDKGTIGSDDNDISFQQRQHHGEIQPRIDERD